MAEPTIRQYEFVAGFGWKDRLYERLLIAIVNSGVTLRHISFSNVGFLSRKCVIQVAGRIDEFRVELPFIGAYPAEYGISVNEVLVTEVL